MFAFENLQFYRAALWVIRLGYGWEGCFLSWFWVRKTIVPSQSIGVKLSSQICLHFYNKVADLEYKWRPPACNSLIPHYRQSWTHAQYIILLFNQSIISLITYLLSCLFKVWLLTLCTVWESVVVLMMHQRRKQAKLLSTWR